MSNSAKAENAADAAAQAKCLIGTMVAVIYSHGISALSNTIGFVARRIA
jgi:hypothetical protein